MINLRLYNLSLNTQQTFQKTFFTFFLLAFTFISSGYAQRLQYSSDIPVQKTRIIPEQTFGGKVSEMLSYLEYIPLETDHKHPINFISSAKVIGNTIGILTSVDGYLYIYSLEDGKLINIITKIEGFKPKWGNVLFYNLDEKEGDFILTHADFVATIDVQGNIKDTTTVEINDQNEFIERKIDVGNSEYIQMESIYREGEGKTSDHALLLGDSVLVRFNLQDTAYRVYSAGDEIYHLDPQKALLVFPYNYEIFELHEDGIHQIYEFIFPYKNTVDTAIYQNKDFEEYTSYLERNPDIIYGIAHPMFHGDYLLLYAASMNKNSWLAHNLVNHETIGLDNIIPDESNDFMELIGRDPIYSNGEYLFSFIYPHQVSLAKNKSLDEKHTMRKEYKDLEKHNNPILVRFKIK